MSPILTCAEAAERLLSGAVVAYPTETLYGLAALPGNEAALRRLVAIKGRDEGKPVGLVLASAADLVPLVSAVPTAVADLVRHFWPGPLTVVLETAAPLHPIISAGTGTVAVRVPGLLPARELAALAGGAITATSANRQGETPPSTARQVVECFADELASGLLAGIADGSDSPGGPPSTIVRPIGDELLILRAGAVPEHEIASAWPGVTRLASTERP